MYQVVTVIFALAVIWVAAWFELKRQRGGIFVDAQCVANWIFAVCFGLAPIGVQLLEAEDFGPFDWALSIDRAGPEFALATGLGLLGLASFHAAYRSNWTARICSLVPRVQIDSNQGLVGGVALVFLSLAVLAAFVMVQSVDSAWILIQYAMAFRAGASPFETEWLFLRNIVLFAVPASFLACGLVLAKSSRALFWRLVLAGAIVLSIAGLLHSGGRLSLAAYLAVFVIYACSNRQGHLSATTVAAGVMAALLFVVFGKYALWAFLMPDAIEQTSRLVAEQPMQLLATPLLEFSFPVYSLANTLDVTPFEAPLRWFVDFPLAVVTLLPQKLLGLEQPTIVALVNAQLLNHPVPPDLLGTGYFSAGLAGALAMAAALGFLAKAADTVLCDVTGTGRLIGLAWSILLGFRVMYGDPTHAVFSGLGLMACTLALFLGLAPFRRSAGPKLQSNDSNHG